MPETYTIIATSHDSSGPERRMVRSGSNAAAFSTRLFVECGYRHIEIQGAPRGETVTVVSDGRRWTVSCGGARFVALGKPAYEMDAEIERFLEL
jgi:hypothetical protein